MFILSGNFLNTFIALRYEICFYGSCHPCYSFIHVESILLFILPTIKSCNYSDVHSFSHNTKYAMHSESSKSHKDDNVHESKAQQIKRSDKRTVWTKSLSKSILNIYLKHIRMNISTKLPGKLQQLLLLKKMERPCEWPTLYSEINGKYDD